MDDSTLETLAELICGDDERMPVRRSGPQLTEFFRRSGLTKFRHHGPTRRTWVRDSLRRCSDAELEAVVLRLADPREYGGDRQKVNLALDSLNQALSLEGIEVSIADGRPLLHRVPVTLVAHDAPRSANPPPQIPNFGALHMEPKIERVLTYRWAEVERCISGRAYFAATVMMGSLLETLLLSVIRIHPGQANQSSAAPKAEGRVRVFGDWTLNDMINVTHERGWIDRDVTDFSHILRVYRNLIHPNQQLETGAAPDADTVNMCWPVVQAAVNDLTRTLGDSGDVVDGGS